MKKRTLRIVCVLCAIAIITACFAGCGKKSSDTSDSAMTGTIDVISRESGSGTRGAFTELLGIVDADKNDATVSSAEVTNSTSVMLTTVAGDKQAIGYASLGSLTSEAAELGSSANNLKTLSLDGVEASTDNINNGTYKLSRPFNICYKDGSLSTVSQDFVNYILSTDGQKIIAKEGYISVDATKAYTASGASGTISISGSTSVGPVMEILADAYKKLNPKVTINIAQNGSTAGIQAAEKGVVDFGMSSRELTTDEAAKLKADTIAKDGIAIIVNSANPLKNITSDQAKSIYLGKTTTWDGLTA